MRFPPCTLRLLRSCSNTHLPIQARRTIHPNTSRVGLAALRSSNNEDESSGSRYPTFERMNVTTENRVHKFNVECNQVIKFIKLGAINKNVAVQYCHYLTDIARNAQESDKDYYRKRCIDLMSYLLRNYKDMPIPARCQLLIDVASLDAETCKTIHSNHLDELLISKFSLNHGKELMASYYKFQMWEQAQEMLLSNQSSFVNIFTVMWCLEAVIDASTTYKKLEGDAKTNLRSNVAIHLLSMLERCQTHRIYVVSKCKTDLIKALQDLDFKVQVNPTIKMSGRCTSCESRLPLYDPGVTKTINEAILKQIKEGSENDLYLNAAPNDIRRFENFLTDLYKRDKRPIDCVVDGLNVSYKNSLGYKFLTKTYNDDVQKTIRLQNPEMQSRVLINLIIRGNFLKEFKKILVVGKHHMTKWPGLMDFFAKHGIHYYSSFNNSQDDLFQLYAATLNHKTVLVTNDFLRDHIIRMDTPDRKLFERWIDTHQVWINQKNLKPIFPTPYEKVPSVDRDTNCFHVPIVDGNMIDDIGVTEPPAHLNSKLITWICCKSHVDEKNEEEIK